MTDAVETSRRRYRPDETRERILSAAQALFAQKGYAATSTADIATAAGVAEGSIFYHFGSKKNLMVEIGSIFGRNMVEAMRGDCTDLASLDTTTMISRCMAFVEKNGDPDVRSGMTGVDPELQSMMSASREVVMGFVTELMTAAQARHPDRAIDVPVAAALAYAAVHEAIHLCCAPESPFPRERVLRETIRFVGMACDAVIPYIGRDER